MVASVCVVWEAMLLACMALVVTTTAVVAGSSSSATTDAPEDDITDGTDLLQLGLRNLHSLGSERNAKRAYPNDRWHGGAHSEWHHGGVNHRILEHMSPSWGYGKTKVWLPFFGWTSYFTKWGDCRKLREMYCEYTLRLYCQDEVVRCGDAEWMNMKGAEACAQKGTQSPIDIRFEDSQVPESHDNLPTPLKIGDPDSKWARCKHVEYETNPHTMEVKVSDECADRTYIEFPLVEDKEQWSKFYLRQFHFTSPSENTVNGKHYPMEMQVVHKSKEGQILVVSVMIGASNLPNGSDVDRARWFSRVLEMEPEGGPKLNTLGAIAKSSASWHAHFEDEGVEKQKRETELDLNPYTNFINTDMLMDDGYYFWNGSLTTPPCTNKTYWIIHPQPAYILPKSIDWFRRNLNENANNQLMTYGDIYGHEKDAYPKWADSAVLPELAEDDRTRKFDDYWNPDLGCNIRPVQPMTGADDPNRQLFLVDTASTEEGKKQRTSLHMVDASRKSWSELDHESRGDWGLGSESIASLR